MAIQSHRKVADIYQIIGRIGQWVINESSYILSFCRHVLMGLLEGDNEGYIFRITSTSPSEINRIQLFIKKGEISVYLYTPHYRLMDEIHRGTFISYRLHTMNLYVLYYILIHYEVDLTNPELIEYINSPEMATVQRYARHITRQLNQQKHRAENMTFAEGLFLKTLAFLPLKERSLQQNRKISSLPSQLASMAFNKTA